MKYYEMRQKKEGNKDQEEAYGLAMNAKSA